MCACVRVRARDSAYSAEGSARPGFRLDPHAPLAAAAADGGLLAVRLAGLGKPRQPGPRPSYAGMALRTASVTCLSCFTDRVRKTPPSLRGAADRELVVAGRALLACAKPCLLAAYQALIRCFSSPHSPPIKPSFAAAGDRELVVVGETRVVVCVKL